MSEEKSMKHFFLLWSGQFASMLGSAMSAFGISLWILNNTKSTTSFALTFLLRMLPEIIFAPLAGSYADRKNKKKIMILTDTLDALLKVILAVFLIKGDLNIYLIYISMFLGSTLSSFQGPALNASIPLIVSKKSLGRANGMMQLIYSIQAVVAPIAGGILYVTIGLLGLFVLDFISFSLAIITILPQKIPDSVLTEEEKREKYSVANDMVQSYQYLKTKPGLIQLMVSFSILNFLANFCMVLLGPLVMALANESAYGLVNSASGLGMLVGGLAAGLVPAKDNKIKMITLSLLLSSLGLVLMGVSKIWFMIGLGYFLFMLPVPYANGTLGTVIQSKIENKFLGRTGALFQILLKGTSPLAIILAGFSADKFFIPLLQEGGYLTDTFLSKILGVGPASGISLMYVISGLGLFFVCLYLLGNSTVMGIDKNLPDY